MKKVIKTMMLVLATLCTVLVLASCGEKAHEHSYIYESDATKHRQVCTDCGEATRWDAHVWGEWTVTKEATVDEKGSQEHTCTVCGYKGTEEIPMLTPTTGETSDWTNFYAYVPEGFTDVNIYYWGDNLEEAYKVGWPGLPMTLVNEAEGLYGYTLPAGVANVIINGSLGQTVDVAYSPDRNALKLDTLDGEKYTVIYASYTTQAGDPELAKPEASEPVENITLYVVDQNAWEVVNVHYWGSKDGGSDWPGLVATKLADVTVDGSSAAVYSVEIPEDATTIIVNNGTEQTENIVLVADANCVVVSGTSSVYAKYENGTVTVVEVDLGLPEFYLVGTISSWSFADEYKLVIDEETMTATITYTFAEGDSFKIALSGWSGEVSSSNYGDLGAAFSVAAEGGNITVVTAGTYRIVVSGLDSTPSLTITAVTE